MARKPKTTKAPAFDIDMVRAAAARRWPEILSHLGGVDRELFDGRHTGCPKCGGTDRFRMIDPEAGAVLCNQCFREKNGDGFAALQWLLSVDFRTALAKVAEYVGVSPSTSPTNSKRHSADPAEHLEFLDWHDGLANTWCVLRKPGITPMAMQTAGCRLARYRKQFSVFALPIWGPKLTEAEPVGWALYNVSGGTLPMYTKGKPVEQVKVKLTYGSQQGILGPVDHIAAAHTLWKVEGPSDMLAMLSLADLPEGVVPITNANGAGEKPLAWMVKLFTDKRSLVVHDADQPGQDGAGRWCEAIAVHAAECRHVQLPFSIDPSHGRDLRDWINGAA